MRERTAIKTEFCPPNYVSALVPTLHTDSFDAKGNYNRSIECANAQLGTLDFQ